MLKVALKNLLSHKLRMALTGFSVVLGVSFVAGTYIFTDSINSTFDSLFSQVYSGVDVSVRPAKTDLGAAEVGFDESVFEAVKAVEGVGVAEPSVAGYAQLIGNDGKPIGGQGPPALGFSWQSDPELNSLKINDGDGQAPVEAGQVVIDKATAETNNFKVGDKVKILLAGPAEEFEIVGIATFGSSDGLAGATISSFELKEAQRVFGLQGKYSVIDSRAVSGITPDELQTRIARVLPEGLEAITGQSQANEELSSISEGLGFLNTALLAFAGVAIFVGSFIIQNTFRIIVSQRTKELALLRALGAKRGQVLKIVVYEAFVIGLVASALGLLAGIGISYGVRGLLDAIGFGLPPGPLSVTTRTIIVSFGVGTIVTTLSSLMPALAASRLSPIEALREGQAPTKRKALLKRGLIGAVMIAVGGLLVVFGLNKSGLSNPVYYVGFGAIIQFLGVSVMAPLLAVPVSRSIGWVMAKFKGTSARLAYRNAARSPRRTASTAAALMIGVSLIAFVSILASSFKGAIDTIISENFVADLTITSTNSGDAGPGSAGFSVEAYSALNELNELSEVSAVRYAFTGYKISGDESAFTLAGVDHTNFGDLIKLGFSDGSPANLDNSSILVSNSLLARNKLTVGDSVDITYAKTGLKTYKIAGSFSEAFDSEYLIANDEYLNNFSSNDVTYLLAKYASGLDASKSKEVVVSTLAGYPQLQIQDQSDLVQTAKDQINQILALFWGLLAMAVIIAIFGITNTLMLSITERTREIGLLRAVGTTRKQLRSMIRYESVIIALFGALLGLGMGMFFAWAVISALNGQGIEKIVISYQQLVIYLVLAIVAGVLAAAWPAFKASRMDVLKSISYE